MDRCLSGSSNRDGEAADARLRRDLLKELLDRMWSRIGLPEEEAIKLAIEAQHQSRKR